MSTATNLRELTVGQVMQLLPGSIDILNRHLIDTCCGEKRLLPDAAQDANASLDELLDDLRELERHYTASS